jgi:hypothetical protein
VCVFVVLLGMVWPNGFGMDFNGLIDEIFSGYCDLGSLGGLIYE